MSYMGMDYWPFLSKKFGLLGEWTGIGRGRPAAWMMVADQPRPGTRERAQDRVGITL